MYDRFLNSDKLKNLKNFGIIYIEKKKENKIKMFVVMQKFMIGW